MILRALTNYYEQLLRENKAAPWGWCQAKAAFALDLSEDGNLRGIISLKTEAERGKKKVWIPAVRRVPQMVARSSGVAANFLCDNSKYMLGIDAKGCGGRLRECFEAAGKKHEEILAEAHGRMAEAIRGFFKGWEPENAFSHPMLQEVWEEVTDGSNLIFCMDGYYEAQEDEEVRRAWEKYIENRDSGEKGVCLVTGEKTSIARIHAAVKGVSGAQSSGASLVSFNAPSFESYGKEQSYNAPVGEYAAFAYTTALNYLLSDRKYVAQIGDTTVVYWAENGGEDYKKAFLWTMEPQIDNQEAVRGIFERLKRGQKIDINGMVLDENKHFFVLGLTPNAARLSVKFFYQDSFGNILKHLEDHYRCLEIVRPSRERREYLGIGELLQETVNQKAREKKPVPGMAAAMLAAVLSGGRYPSSLYMNLMIRIRAEQGKLTWGRASIVKAYLIKNYHWSEGEMMVAINENMADAAYVMGEIFAVLEKIQQEANPGINTTIRDRYFNSACTTPAMVFPILFRLKNSHIRKMETEGKRIYYEKMITELMGRLDGFPARLSLENQGKFMLGYYHQVQKFYTKKEEK